MKDIRFNINLYIIIPIIFAGFTTLSILVTFQVMHYYFDRKLPPQWPLAFWSIVLVLFTYLCGILVVKYLIQPVQKFVDRTQTMGVLHDIGSEEDFPTTSDPELFRFSRVFDQVSEIISKVQARELFPDIIGQSTPMRAVLNQILKVAPSDSTVLIVGETGTGKELVANSIHRHSKRQNRSFLAMNCAAIPEGLLESELFGHEKGAFTGASQRKLGKVEIAHLGTLFLDEIGDMPLETQAKILRTLEEQQVVRVGGMQPIKIDTRFIAATNKNLPELVKSNRFRQDLFYRLNVFAIYLPPLRQRREDIPLLCEHFLHRHTPDKQLSAATIQLLMAYEWPGNIRELQNAIQSAAVMTGVERIIEPVHLPTSITQKGPTLDVEAGHFATHHDPNPPSKNQNIDQQLQELEKKMILQALTQSHGIQKQAANLLGINKRSLYHRLKKYDIHAASFKTEEPNKLQNSVKKLQKL